MNVSTGTKKLCKFTKNDFTDTILKMFHLIKESISQTGNSESIRAEMRTL